ncbi:helix-turn-helix domain-containing protein [Nonomuraea ferruginea]
MPTIPHRGIGGRVAYHRSVARLTQRQLADAASIHVGTLRKIERGARGASDNIVESLAAALGIDPSLLVADRAQASSRIAAAIPALSAAIAAYDLPDDGPVRPLPELRAAVSEAVTWRLASQYVRITRRLPELLGELFRATPERDREVAALLVSACRAADAVAFKFGAYDLSARFVELMRWAAAQADDPILTASVAYVRTETFFACDAHAKGLRALELALDAAGPPDTPLGHRRTRRTTHAGCGHRQPCRRRRRCRHPSFRGPPTGRPGARGHLLRHGLRAVVGAHSRGVRRGQPRQRARPPRSGRRPGVGPAP